MLLAVSLNESLIIYIFYDAGEPVRFWYLYVMVMISWSLINNNTLNKYTFFLELSFTVP